MWLQAVSSVAWTELTASSQDTNGMQSALKQIERRVPADPSRPYPPLRQNETVSLRKLDTQSHTRVDTRGYIIVCHIVFIYN